MRTYREFRKELFNPNRGKEVIKERKEGELVEITDPYSLRGGDILELYSGKAIDGSIRGFEALFGARVKVVEKFDGNFICVKWIDEKSNDQANGEYYPEYFKKVIFK